MKPTWIQFCLKHPEFEKDEALRSAIGLDYTEENLLKMAKVRDIASQGVKTLAEFGNIKQPTIMPDGTIGDEPVFDPKFLVEKYMDFSDFDLKLNAKYKAERKSEMERLAAAYKRIQAADGAAAAPAGGGAAQAPGGDMGMGGFGAPDMGMGGVPPVGGEAPVGGAAAPAAPEAPAPEGGSQVAF
jgi:hypothetical protein